MTAKMERMSIYCIKIFIPIFFLPVQRNYLMSVSLMTMWVEVRGRVLDRKCGLFLVREMLDARTTVTMIMRMGMQIMMNARDATFMNIQGRSLGC